MFFVCLVSVNDYKISQTRVVLKVIKCPSCHFKPSLSGVLTAHHYDALVSLKKNIGYIYFTVKATYFINH